MGKLIQGINGPFTGKVGPAVGSSWRGISVIRSLPSPRTRPFTQGRTGSTDEVQTPDCISVKGHAIDECNLQKSCRKDDRI